MIFAQNPNMILKKKSDFSIEIFRICAIFIYRLAPKQNLNITILVSAITNSELIV